MRMNSSQPTNKFRSGTTKKHAPRIPPKEWKRYKYIICEKYQNATLKSVMEYMELNHDFTPTKRQYVHQLKKWDEGKYKKGLQIAPPPRSKKPGRTDIRKAQMKHNRSGSTSSLDDLDNERETGSFTLSSQSQSAHDTDEDEEMQEPLAANSWPSSLYQYDSGTYTHLRVKPEQLDGFDAFLEKKKTMADFDFSMSDDRASFESYKACYDLLDQKQESSLAFLRPFLVVSMARSAQTPEHIEIEQKTLGKILFDPETPTPISAVYKLLEAYMLDRNKDKDRAKEIITDVLDNTIVDGKSLSWSRGTGLGVVPYPFLIHAIRRYNEGQEPQHCLDEGSIMGHFLQQTEDEFQGRHGYRLVAVVRDCLSWCLRVLEEKPDIPPVWQNIPCETDDLLEWKDDYELFCYFWQTKALAGPHKPFWVQRAEQDLCISATELLITTSYMIMDGDDEEGNANEGDAPQEHDPDHLVRRALNNAKFEASGDDARLWRHFLHKFCWMNELVDMKQKDKTFKSEVMEYVRKYVAEMLTSSMYKADGPESYSKVANGKKPELDYRHPGSHSVHNIHDSGNIMSVMTAQNRLGQMQLNLCS